MNQLHKNILAAYNEALDNNRISEEIARQEIGEKYNVIFANWENGRYTTLTSIQKGNSRFWDFINFLREEGCLIHGKSHDKEYVEKFLRRLNK